MAKTTFTMRHLWRMTEWGGAAAGALLVAVLVSRSETGTERIAGLFSGRSDRVQLAAPPVDAEAEARRVAEQRRLADAVRGLTAENDELKSRLAAVERNMDDITGSVARQIEAIKKTDTSPPPDRSPPAPTPVAAAPASRAVIAAPPAASAPPPAPAQRAAAEPSPPRAAMPAPVAPPPRAATPAPAPYGVDVGRAVSVQVLRARWLGIRSAHGQLFEGLTPVVMLREIPHTGRLELRLVAGPLANAAAAARLCAALAPYRLPCQPTPFSSQHVALQ